VYGGHDENGMRLKISEIYNIKLGPILLVIIGFIGLSVGYWLLGWAIHYLLIPYFIMGWVWILFSKWKAKKRTKEIKKAALLLLILFLTGCAGPRVAVKNINQLSIETRRQVLSMPIYNESQLFGKKYSVINVVEGISCKNKVWDPAATKTDAINQAKYWAYEIGADGLLNIQCDFPRGTTTTYNCWESITCTAQAIKFEN